MSPPSAEQERPRSFPDPFRWIIEHPTVVDSVVWGGAALVLLLLGPATGSAGWWMLFSIPMFATAAICRVRPGLGMGIIAALAILHVACGVLVMIGDAVTFYALFCAVAYGSRAVHATGIGLGLLGVVVQASGWAWESLRLTSGEGIAQAFAVFMSLLVTGTISIVAVWALANLQRARVRQLDLQRERAEQAVREREQRTALAVADERARIAREMHDVVAHSLSVIIAQADGGRFIATQHPERAADVLGTIGDTGRAALADMRSLLGVLRKDESAAFGPQPGPETLPELIERVEAAGLPVRLSQCSDLSDLPQALGVSLFRLVQEALTNVMKHAGEGATASVSIRRTPDLVEVEIIDDGRGIDPDSDGMGHGITGMRERVAVYGGTLVAAPLPGRGFRVLATLPLRTAPAQNRDTGPAASAQAQPAPTPPTAASHRSAHHHVSEGAHP